MPLDTETFDLAAEADRIDEQIDILRDERQEILDGLDADEEQPNSVQVLAERIGSLRRYKDGLEWARSVYEVDEITLGAPTAGEMALIEDQSPDDVGTGQVRIYFVAAGTIEAPWLAHDADAPTPDDYLDTVSNVSQLSHGLVKWAEAQINDLGRVDPDQGNS